MKAHHLPDAERLTHVRTALISEALEALQLPDSEEQREWLGALAIRIVCEAIIREPGRVEFPLACTLRQETANEQLEQVLDGRAIV